MLARQRARRSMWPIFVVAAGVAGYLWWQASSGAFRNHYSSVDGPGAEVVHDTLAHQLAISAAIGLLLLLFVLGRLLDWQADRQVAHTLRLRVGSGHGESFRTVLGPWGVRMLGVQIATQTALVIWAALSRPAPVTLLLAVTCAAILGVSLVGLVREVARPAVAVDAVSLSLDQRLRTSNALAACGLPSTTVFVMVGPDNGGGWVGLAPLVIVIGGWGGALLLQGLGAPERRWPGAPTYPPLAWPDLAR